MMDVNSFLQLAELLIESGVYSPIYHLAYIQKNLSHSLWTAYLDLKNVVCVVIVVVYRLLSPHIFFNIYIYTVYTCLLTHESWSVYLLMCSLASIQLLPSLIPP